MLISFLLILTALPALSQSLGSVDSRSADPFIIAPGTVFSASSSKTHSSVEHQNSTVETILDDIDEAIRLVKQNYVSPTDADADQIAKSSINAMLKTLDPHSKFYDTLEFDDLIGEQKSEYFGTGVTLAEFERDCRIETYLLAIVPGSSAANARLVFGDKIVAVNGKLVVGMHSRQIRSLIRGPRGTVVRITVEREGKLKTVELNRAKIASPTVTNAFLLNDGVGIIELSEGFSLTTPTEFDSALMQLKAAGMRSLVVDLRGNPGGILESAIQIAEKFLPAGSTIVTQRGRGIWDNRVWQSKNRQPEKIPLILLVNRETASASEVIAGALQDNDRALIVGEKTFGKGLVQTVISLPGGAGLTLTTARYFTPVGRSIQRDYEHTGIYDYFRHLQTVEVAANVKLRTRRNRIVTSGEGISPDRLAKFEPVTAGRLALLDPIFFFSREIFGGHVPGLSPEAASKSENDPKLRTEFEKFAALWPSKADLAIKNADWAIGQIKYYLTLAAEGSAAANRFRLRNDKAVIAAVDALPEARLLAASIFEAKSASDINK